jgi:aryl-alcohol dehydrogenase-like predicted oxidoreductase
MTSVAGPDVPFSLKRLALGTVQFGQNYGIANQGGQVPLDEAKAIIKRSHESGMNTLDTAIGYGDSEQRLGQIGIQDWQIVSKLPAIPGDCADNPVPWIGDVIAGSLQRLNVPTLYGLLLHCPQQLLDEGGDRLYRALQQMKYDGLVQKIGISIYSPRELDALCDHYDFDLVQAPFNLLDRRLIETGWLTRMAKQGTEIHVRSVFLQGLLLMRGDARPKKFSQWDSLWAEWDSWLASSNQSPLQACLRYALAFSEITKVIVGVDSVEQLNEVMLAADGSALDAPAEIQTNDINLLNPANWPSLGA